MPHLRKLDALGTLAWRLGRRAYMWGRGDVPNAPATNGEYWLLDQLARRPGSPAPVLFDIGCNRGDWSAHALQVFGRSGSVPSIHCFEPEKVAYEQLLHRFGDAPSVHVNRSAVADRGGTIEFFVVGPVAGTNSLSRAAESQRVQVPVTTLDQYCADNQIGHIDIVKSDVEGYDSHVIDGGLGMLRAGRVGVWQFEYNWRWIEPRRFLRDVFERIGGLPYRLGKLTGARIDILPGWHFELERFFEANFVLLRNDVVPIGLREGSFHPSNVYY